MATSDAPAPAPAEIIANNGRFYNSAIGGRAYYDLEVCEEHLGSLSLEYSYVSKTVKIHSVNIIEEKRRQGYGKAIYKKVTSLPLPDGSPYEDSGYRFVSGY